MARLTNAQKQKNYREKKAREKLGQTANDQTTGGLASNAGDTMGPPVGDDDGVKVEVNAPTPAPQLSLKDRFMARLHGSAPASSPASKPKARGKKADTPNLITSVLPTVTASLVAVYAQDLLPEEYRMCAPTKEEVASIIGPLFDILGRQVEIVGKASQTTMDLINSLVAAFAYGTRAYITYVDIKRTKENPAYVENQREAYRAKLEREAREYNAVIDGSNDNPINQPISLASGLRAYQNQAIGRSGNDASGVSSSANVTAIKDDDERGEPVSEDGDTERRRSDLALVNDMFSRDRRGRVRLGLLPA